MFDAIKSLTGGDKTQKQVEELKALVASAKEERSALSTMLTQLTTRSAKLVETDKVLQRVETRAAAATESFDALAKRLQELEQRATSLGDADKRVQALLDTATSAHAQADRLMAPEGPLEQQRKQVHQLSAQVAEAQARLDALNRERAALEEFRSQLRTSQAELNEIKQALPHAVALRNEVDQVRVVSGQLSKDYATLVETTTKAQAQAEKLTAPEGPLDQQRRQVQQLSTQVADAQATIDTLKREGAVLEEFRSQLRKSQAELTEVEQSLHQAVALRSQVDQVRGMADQLSQDYVKLVETTTRAQAQAEKLTAPEGPLDQQRRQVQQLSTQVAGAQATIDTLKRDGAVLEDFRSQLHKSQGELNELRQSFHQAVALRSQVDQVRGMADRLSHDYASLVETTTQARAQVDQLIAPEGDLAKHRTQVQQLSARVGEAQATIDTLKREGAVLEEFRSRLRKSQADLKEMKESFDRAAALRTDVDQVRVVAGQLSQDYAKLVETTTKAQAQVEQLIGPEGDLDQHRMQVQQLSQQAVDAQASVEALKRERVALEDLRAHIRESHAELKDIKQSIDHALALRTELEQVQLIAAQLSQDYAKLRESSREAREDSAAAHDAVSDVERKLGRLTQLQELSEAIAEKLTSVNALAEHVNQKARALEGQKHVIDRALVEANRLNDMVWNMEIQIGKVNEGLKQAARGEEALAQIEQIVKETHGRLDAAARLRDEFVQETARMEKDGRALAEATRGYVEQLGLEKREFEAFEQRLRAMQSAVQAAEQRMEALGERERQLAHLPQRIDDFGRTFQTLLEHADDLGRKQASLDTLQDQLAHVHDMSARAAAQYESLRQSRADLEVLRKEIQDFHQAYAAAAELRDRLTADRTALEAFGERVAAFRARTPELQATMDGILGRLAQVDEGMRHATRMSEMAAGLEVQLTRVGERMQFVAVLESRLNTLHAVASEVDQKLASQLERRAELDTLKTECDGVVAQMADAHTKLEAVAALQGKLLPMDTRLTVLQDRLEKTGARIKEVRRDESGLARQETRLNELVEASRSLADQVAGRLQQMHGLNQELTRSGSVRDELLGELARVQARQREAMAQTEAVEDHLRRAEAMYRALEQRRSQLAFSEKKLADVDEKMTELVQKSGAIEQQLKGLEDREAVVVAVRAELDSVHQITARSKADLQYISDHREQIGALRRQVQDLLALASATEEKIAAIESRRKDIEAVQAKSTYVANLLEDVRVNLETVSEQKTVVDHLTERLATVQFVMQEAQNTLRMLNQERELAERIGQSIKQLRARTGGQEGEGRQTA